MDQSCETLQTFNTMFRCELSARTCAGIETGQPTLTNLDSHQQYVLTLKKKNDKILEDELNVSIFLQVGSTFQDDALNLKLLKKWKQLHYSERLLNVQLRDSSKESEGISVLNETKHKEQHLDAVYLFWKKNNEVKLNISFNCVSSQFLFNQSQASLNGIFFLNVVISSNFLGTWIEEQCCRIKLFWPGGAKGANTDSDYKLHGQKRLHSFESPCEYTPPCEYTLLSLKSNFQQMFSDLMEFSMVDEGEAKILNDYEEIADEREKCLRHILIEPASTFVEVPQEGDPLQVTFIERGSSLSIKLNLIEPNSVGAQLSKQRFVSRFELQWKDRPFTDMELLNWTTNVAKQMIEIDYTKCKFSANVHDICMEKANVIRLYWSSGRDLHDEVVPVKINCLSTDFTAANAPIGVPFVLTSESFLKKRSIGSAFCHVYTTRPNMAEQTMQMWLQQNEVKERQNHANKIIILNEGAAPDDALDWNQKNKANLFKWHSITSLLPNLVQVSLGIIFLFAILYLATPMLTNEFGLVKPDIDYKVIEKLINEKIELQTKKIIEPEVDYSKIDRMIQFKLESERKIIETFLSETVETELTKKRDTAFDVQQIEKLVQEKLNQQISSKIDKLIEDKLIEQMRNLTAQSIDQQIVERMVDAKLESQLKSKIESSTDFQAISKLLEGKLYDKLQNATVNLQVIEKLIQTKTQEALKEVPNDAPMRSIPMESMKTVPENSPTIEVLLDAPTAAGIQQGNPSLTNLDRNTWYDIRLKKLNSQYHTDHLIVSLRLGLSINSSVTSTRLEQKRFDEWKSLHPFERLFDVQYTGNASSGEPGNRVVRDSNLENENIDSVTFYWEEYTEAKLKIRFYLVNHQFPFKRSLGNEANATFYLHLKVSSTTSCSVIDSAYGQIKLHWPGGASEANHKGNQRLLGAQPYDGIIRSYPLTRFTSYGTLEPLLELSTAPEDEFFIEQLEGFLEQDKATMKYASDQAYMHYILNKPIVTFVNVTTQNGKQFKGFFLDQGASFAIKVLLDSKAAVKLNGALVRTQMHLNLNRRPFKDEELVNWSAKKGVPLLDLDIADSTVPDTVLDIRNVNVNCIEVLWLAKADQKATASELILSLKINALSAEFINEPFLLAIESYGRMNEQSLILDVASCDIHVTEDGQAKLKRKNWLHANGKAFPQSPDSAVLILNDPRPPVSTLFQASYLPIKFNFNVPFAKFNLTWQIMWILIQIFRISCAYFLYNFALNVYENGIRLNTFENARDLTIAFILMLLILFLPFL